MQQISKSKKPQMDVKTRILTEAGNLFYTRGVKSVTMEDIASSTGISKKTIYEHFANKKALLSEWYDVHCNHNREEMIEKEFAECKNPIDFFMVAFDRLTLETRRLHIQFVLDTEKYYPDIYQKKIKSRQAEMLNNIRQFIDEGKVQGYFLKDTNTKVLSVLAQELMKLLGDERLFPISEYRNIDIFKETYLMLMRGIVTEKGRKLIDEAMNKNTEQNISK